MPTPSWLAAAADPVEAAAQLHSRLLVAREAGTAYGHGRLPDWVKEAADPDASFMDKAEGLVRGPLESAAQNTGLSSHLPKSNSNPTDPLGALGSSIRPGLIGAGVGAGLGLVGGLTGKKKRPLSGALFGGLMGGLAGGAGGYAYDRLAGSPAPDKPSPEQVEGAYHGLRGLAATPGTETVAGLTDKNFWTKDTAGQQLGALPANAAVGAAGGAAAGYGLGRAGQARENAKILNIPAQKTVSTVAKGPAGGPPLPVKTTTTLTSPTIPRTPHQGGLIGARRGAVAGGTLYPLAQMLLAARQHGRGVLNGTDPKQVADNLQRITQYASTLPPAAGEVQAARQQMLAEATAMQNKLRTHAGPLTPADRQQIDQLADRLNQHGLIQVKPVAAPTPGQ